MSADYIRRCPTCGTENAPDVKRCACGALLVAVDLVLKQAVVEPASIALEKDAPQPGQEKPAEPIVCPHPDCAQPNPPQSQNCVYCDRPLKTEAALTPPDEMRSLMSLPSKLAGRYRIVRPFPARGAEAELLLVEPLSGGLTMMAKIYRHGIQPDRNVLARVLKIRAEHRVRVFEADFSDGYAYELMEYCEFGSWREQMQGEALPQDMLLRLLRELAPAIAGVHAAGLVHRDLKPENILVRSLQPFDVVLTDFSVSSMLDTTQCFTGTARTLNYASPESLSGVIDGKADYWSLGMILLEGALGKHPFAGLSEPVILHHLTTRSIDLSGVADSNLRRLLAGLLLRDPKLRWGENEITRWLAGDASLPEPVEQRGFGGFAQPYRVGSEVCHTAEQLAVAFAQNWSEGLADMANGQLLSWFRDVQKDQNVVRVLLELRQERQMSVHVQLLKLILHLAPGVPLAWRGEAINTQAVLARANLALQGDTDAAYWLDALYQNRVLEIYAQTGNQEADNLVQKWHVAGRRFDRAWDDMLELIQRREQERNPDEPVNVDALLLGNTGVDRPRMADMHAHLLALAFDVKWAERLRLRLVSELASLVAECPWLVELGDPLAMDAASLLVLEKLLPEARKISERQKKAQARAREAEISECQKRRSEITAIVASLHHLTTNRHATPAVCEEIRRLTGEYHAQLTAARAAGNPDEAWQELIRYAARYRRNIDRIQELVDELNERRAVNAGWLGTETVGAIAIAALVASLFMGERVLFLILAGALGIAAWRLLPNWFRMREIRNLGKML
ncbi:MAG: hypothetical protein H6R01_1468 [Burkholderiaceae bacterium]|nr:hypothetical protein [Burkholderiaceae bacterium]